MKNRLVVVAMTMFLCVSAFAQQRPYDDTIYRNPWLFGSNKAGLRADTSDNVSYAELSARYETGDFRDVSDASSLWKYGVEACTIKHLKNLSMKGGFSFSQMDGQAMCGSMLIGGNDYPVDVYEFTPGKKTLQTYAIDGEIAFSINDKLSIGGDIDLSSANYSKRKDLRHTNYRLDLKVSPGIRYDLGSISFGANYIFAKNSESVVAEQIGTGESSYYAFLDKGLMYGKYEVWTGSGVHLDEAGVQGFPIKETYNGFGIQCGAGGAYVDVEYLLGNGSAGEKQSVWYRFPSKTLKIHTASQIDFRAGTLYARKYLVHSFMANSETVLDKVTENGVTTTIEYGSNVILERRKGQARIEYEWVGRKFECIGGWTYDRSRSVATQMYPYITDNKLTVNSIDLSPMWHVGKFDIGATGAVNWGRSKETGRLLDEDSGVTTEPYRLEDWYDKHLEYQTATKFTAKAMVRRTFVKGIYVQTSVWEIYAPNVELISGASRYGAELRLGWTF